MNANSPFQSLPFDLSSVDRERLSQLADKAQVLATEAVATTAELGRQTVESMRGATAGSRQQVADFAVEALQETSTQLQRLSAHLSGAAEPTAEQVTDALEQVVAWLDARRDQLVAEVSRTRGDVETRFAPATRAEVADLQKRVSVLEGRTTRSSSTKSAAKKSTATKSSGAKAPAKKVSATKAPARKAPAKAKKSTATKSSAGRSTGRTSAAPSAGTSKG